MNYPISPIIAAQAPLILAEIQKASRILLHCHPSPDPDSVGSALAMKFALESLGKKVTVIAGDSVIPDAFSHFPGFRDIVTKNFFDISLSDYDLFIIQDSGSPQMISRLKPITLPLAIPTVVIDHHVSNSGYAGLNLIEPAYPAVCQILYDLFILWQVPITTEIAANLFIGIYTDTGGFKYDGTTERTFEVAAGLTHVIPDFPRIISDMENSAVPLDIEFQALALSSVKTFLDGRLGLSVISAAALKEHYIPVTSIHGEAISPILRSVREWMVTGIVIEVSPGHIKMSFRSKDPARFDVSRLAVALGGGGHKAAAGATVEMTIEDATTQVVARARELYNL